jgi:hypothetical protein
MTFQVPIPFILLAEDDERDRRYNLCKECNKFDTVTRTCTECNCIMPVKTCWQDSTCPLNKW